MRKRRCVFVLVNRHKKRRERECIWSDACMLLNFFVTDKWRRLQSDSQGPDLPGVEGWRLNKVWGGNALASLYAGQDEWEDDWDLDAAKVRCIPPFARKCSGSNSQPERCKCPVFIR